MKLSTAIATMITLMFLILCWILTANEAKASLPAPAIDSSTLGFEADYLELFFICVEAPEEYRFIYLYTCGL